MNSGVVVVTVVLKYPFLSLVCELSLKDGEESFRLLLLGKAVQISCFYELVQIKAENWLH